MVTLRCPACQREKRVLAEDGETPDSVVMLRCPEHWKAE
jgi:hypothetical protein